MILRMLMVTAKVLCTGGLCVWLTSSFLLHTPKSFSLVVVSDALDYLSLKYLNRTLPELARVSARGLVVFTGYPGLQRAKVADISKFGRPAKMRSSSRWISFFLSDQLRRE